MKKLRLLSIILVLVMVVGLFSGCSAVESAASQIKAMAKNNNYTMEIFEEQLLSNTGHFRFIYSNAGKLSYCDNGVSPKYYDSRDSAEVIEFYERNNGVWYYQQINWENSSSLARPYTRMFSYKALVLAMDNLEENFEIDGNKWVLKEDSYKKIFPTQSNGVCTIAVINGKLKINITHGSNNSEVATITKVGFTSLKVPKIDFDITN